MYLTGYVQKIYNRQYDTVMVPLNYSVDNK